MVAAALAGAIVILGWPQPIKAVVDSVAAVARFFLTRK